MHITLGISRHSSISDIQKVHKKQKLLFHNVNGSYSLGNLSSKSKCLTNLFHRNTIRDIAQKDYSFILRIRVLLNARSHPTRSDEKRASFE